MTFTNDDLKRLKEWLENPKFTSANGYLADGPTHLGKALITRLVAAERVITTTFSWLNHTMDDSRLTAARAAYKEWFRAKGEEK
jgi:hypothetical protein